MSIDLVCWLRVNHHRDLDILMIDHLYIHQFVDMAQEHGQYEVE